MTTLLAALIAWDLIGGGYILGCWLATRPRRYRPLGPGEALSFGNYERQAIEGRLL